MLAGVCDINECLSKTTSLSLKPQEGVSLLHCYKWLIFTVYVHLCSYSFQSMTFACVWLMLSWFLWLLPWINWIIWQYFQCGSQMLRPLKFYSVFWNVDNHTSSIWLTWGCMGSVSWSLRDTDHRSDGQMLPDQWLLTAPLSDCVSASRLKSLLSSERSNSSIYPKVFKLGVCHLLAVLHRKQKFKCSPF